MKPRRRARRDPARNVRTLQLSSPGLQKASRPDLARVPLRARPGRLAAHHHFDKTCVRRGSPPERPARSGDFPLWRSGGGRGRPEGGSVTGAAQFLRSPRRNRLTSEAVACTLRCEPIGRGGRRPAHGPTLPAVAGNCGSAPGHVWCEARGQARRDRPDVEEFLHTRRRIHKACSSPLDLRLPTGRPGISPCQIHGIRWTDCDARVPAVRRPRSVNTRTSRR